MSFRKQRKTRTARQISPSMEDREQELRDAESNNEITTLLRKRDAVKSKLNRFSIFFNSIKDNHSTTQSDLLLQLEIRLNQVEDGLLNEFSSIQFNLQGLDAESFNESDIEEFETFYFSLISQAKQYLSISSKASQLSINNNSNVIRSNVKLPPIELPKFSGSYERWCEFKDLFISLVHNCDILEPIQKYHYLYSSLEGAAAQCIKSIEISSDNYQLAWQILCERFDNKRLMVHNHLKKICNIRDIKTESAYILRELVDNISKHMRSLENLGLSTNSWDPILIYLITSKLNEETLRDWEKQEFSQELPSLSELKSFLSNRADILDKVNMHKPKIAKNTLLTGPAKPKSKKGYVCYYCQKPHSIYSCIEFLKLSIPQRYEKISSLKLCCNCLQRGHAVQDCKYGNCKHCSEKHNSLLHNSQHERLNKEAKSEKTASNSKDISDVASSSRTFCNAVSKQQVLLCTALVNVYDNNGHKHIGRVLLDNASMSNFVTESFVNRLGVSQKSINFTVAGIGQVESNIKSSCSLKIESRCSSYKVNLNCLVIPEITGNLPSFFFNKSLMQIPSHIKLADPEFNVPNQVDILLGADTFWNILCEGNIYLGKGNPNIHETEFGWIVSGSLSDNNVGSFNKGCCHLSKNLDLESQLTKFWEIEEVSVEPSVTSEDIAVEKHFVDTFKRNSEGRFIISVPLKEPITKLGNSKDKALKQFLNLEKKLQSNSVMRELYTTFMQEYQDLCHMSEFCPTNSQITYYSPHHGILREQSLTTNLRVVFNSSASSTSGYSYNSIQMVGPVIQNDLVSILLRFRQHVFIINADICKMYRQILVDDDTKPLQLIFWRSKPEDQLKVFSLDTVTYGTASAPYLATRCLKQLALENKSDYPHASQVILQDFYMDDLISGADSEEEAINLGLQVSNILASGCFTLRKWRSNSQNVLNGMQCLNNSSDNLYFCPLETSKTLGIAWASAEDYFTFNINLTFDNSKQVSKRIILSEIAKIFDPLGLVGPVVVRAKTFLQSLWSLKLSWDEDIPSNLLKKWHSFKDELFVLNSLKICRHVFCRQPISIQLHGFSDASQIAYGACIYARSVDSFNHVHVHLICSKTRVAPLKQVSIPKLELCAALLLAQLYKKVINAFSSHFQQYYLWSDSTVTLAWIRSFPHKLKPFVENRVTTIQNLTDSKNWRYVPTHFNPADILSRGVSPKVLVTTSSWFQGSDWLYKLESQWPEDITLKDPLPMNNLPELRKNVTVLVSFEVKFNQFFPFNNFSSLSRLKHVGAYMLRFIHNCRNKNDRKYGNLSLYELRNSMETLIKLSQKESFPNEFLTLQGSNQVSKGSKLLNLTPFLERDFIRVGGRLKHSEFNFEKKHPLVLLSKHPLTELIFKNEHISLLHCGPQFLLAHVRESYWPIAGRSLAKRIVRECIICFRCKPRSIFPLMGDLPKPRVTPNLPFINTGIDYAGPFLIKNNLRRKFKFSKCYICLFICLSTKAVHLEPVADLTTQAFLDTFQRFIARRGKPSDVYSDNGSNFIGANNYLKDLAKFLKSNEINIVQQLGNALDINWHFIPAFSPHQGGIWEAGIKVAKYHLKRVLSNASLSLDGFYTILTQIENILNSRPLTPLSSDPNDFSVLTPAHFLIGRSFQSIPFRDVQNVPSNRLSHFEYLEKLKQHYWTRWSKEYIGQLQERVKWKTHQQNLSIGDMVLVRNDFKPSYQWRLGRIIDLHKGRDNVVRVVSIKTSHGIIKRATATICPLPINKAD